MPVPPFQDLFLPFLRFVADGKEHTKQEVAAHLTGVFQLTDAEVKEILPSGKQTKFMNRVAWTRTYLGKALLIESPSRGLFRITKRGNDLLATSPSRIDVRTLKAYEEFKVFHASGGQEEAADTVGVAERAAETPEERLESSYLALRRDLAQNLVQQTLKASPAFFEDLVVKLLVAIGYGGSRADAGKAVGKSGDEGIDGIIKEDRLGLDTIYLQAKRWQGSVGRPQVQAFVGSLVGKGATKGVMLTTSTFTDDAKEYVRHLHQKVVLIGGEELADLMIDHNVGVTTTETYTVKKLDMDFFGDE
jgi:restriction system protein